MAVVSTPGSLLSELIVVMWAGNRASEAELCGDKGLLLFVTCWSLHQ